MRNLYYTRCATCGAPPFWVPCPDTVPPPVRICGMMIRGNPPRPCKTRRVVDDRPRDNVGRLAGEVLSRET